MDRKLYLIALIILLRKAQSIDETLYFDKSKPNIEIALSPEDFERARYNRVNLRLQQPHRPDDNRYFDDDSVLYRRDRFEGDIVGVDARSISPQQPMVQSQQPQRGGVFRSAVRNRWQTWPTRRIPYSISAQYSSFSRSRIASALDEYSKKTCVRFVPRTNERDYVFIAPDDGCYSTIGRAGGKQVVSIGAGCVNFGIIIHELMHSVGFFHEQSRPDRDEYVVVNWTNVAEDMKDQFVKYNYGMINTMGFIYDYGSVMHYSNRAFTKNGEATLLPRVDGVKIGQREGFSHLDMTKINALYTCDEFPSTSADNTPQSAFEQTSSPPQILPVAVVPSSETCLDEMDDCLYRKNLGYCETLAHWMKRYCKKTCTKCQDQIESARETAVNQTETCLDSNPHCDTWAKGGFCQSGNLNLVDHMRRNCKKICGFC